jgi:hypothetical protein
VKELIESWKVDSTCVDQKNPSLDESEPCKNHLHRKEWAFKECSLIDTPGPENPFSPCLERLDSNEIRKSHIECMYDACSCDIGGDCECLCSSLAAFGELCIAAGIPVKWRTQHRCPIQCEYGKEYLSCGSLCQPTCEDLSTGNNPSCENDGCIEGCFCPNGFVQNYDGKCVQPINCECRLDNIIYPAQSLVKMDCEICECINGTFVCFQEIPGCKPKCNNETEFTCSNDHSCIPKEWICVIN